MKNSKSGHLFVISAPSGAGKTTLWQKVIKELDGVVHSISMTTRPPRPGEVDGKDYFFVDEVTFKKYLKQDHFLEWALVFGNYYGTPKEKVVEWLNQGKDVILSIDVQGARQIKRKFPQAVLIFILPPDLDTLQARLEQRGTDNRDEIQRRLKIAQEEIACLKEYDYKIVNDNLEVAANELKAVIIAARRKGD